jgi:anti-sigma factor RsiW
MKKSVFMNHLTVTEIFQLIDRTLNEAELNRLTRHLSECARCRNEVELHRTLGRAAQQQQLVQTSPRFTANVMERAVPQKEKSFFSWILRNIGTLIAMVAVLGVLGYVLSTTPMWTSMQEQTESSGLTKMFSSAYQDIKQFFADKTNQVTQRLDTDTSARSEKILLIAFISIVVLALLDRFVLRQFMRTKLRTHN